LATRLVQARPDCAVWLVDLRNHGQSQGAPPPHTLQACVDDLLGLFASAGQAPPLVAGHSYGGKVALELARRPYPQLRQVWALDTLPALTAGEDDSPAAVERVLSALRSVPQPLASREAVVGLLADRGLELSIGQWMTTNLRATDEGYRWVFDLDAIDAMLASYFTTDSWPVLRQPPPQLDVHLVRAGRSPRWTADILRALASLDSPHVHVHLLAQAGHWVHVDDPDGVLALLLQGVAALWPH
jgi:pimeloyl-ACP methyl ester carboxylesterase